MSESQNPIITDTEIGNDDVRRSEAGSKRGSHKASSTELTAALVESQETIALLRKELAEVKAKEAQQSEKPANNGIQELAAAIVEATHSRPQTISDIDNINRTTDFKNVRATVDGTSMMESQQVLQDFRNEDKKPISIPKSFSNVFGPNLSITVNGIRVSIPCDGKTHFVNESHWEHARERIAKVDAMNEQGDQEVILE